MRYAAILVAFLALYGCIATYGDFPIQGLQKKPPAGTYTKLYYNVKRFNVLDMGGYEKLRQVFSSAKFFEETVAVEAPKAEGVYVEVDTKWKPLSFPALAFGYLSVATLTLLPAPTQKTDKMPLFY